MKIKFSASILMTAIFCGIVFSQERGVEIKVKKADGQTQDVRLYSGSYALVIGNSEYSNGWDRLSGVKSDIAAVRNVLQRHSFIVETEENLTSERFETRIRKFINEYGFDRDNRLIIYYAGHGYTLNSAGDKRELGYIIPSDTPLPNKDEKGFRQRAVSMIAIQSFARQIQAKHALFVFDSCFSGKLFALRDTLKVTPFIYEKVDSPVRQFITAGNETQTVPDESIFRKAFVRGLEGEADRNNDSYITGTELADYLKEKVTNYSERRQTPQYGLINDIDLDRGDMVFAISKLEIKSSLTNLGIEQAQTPKNNSETNSKSEKIPLWFNRLTENQIIPGIGLAGIKIGLEEDKVIKILGKPATFDKSNLWNSLIYKFKSIVFVVYTTPEGYVKGFRLYDDNFNKNKLIKGTKEGVSLGSSLSQLINTFGELNQENKSISVSCSGATKDGKSVYYNYNGITFVICDSNKLIYMIDVQ